VLRTLVVAAALVGAVWVVAVLVLVVIGRRTAARELALLLPNLFALFRGLARDPRVPRRTRFLLVFAAAWIASPIDLIPEFIPVLGPLDDAVVAVLVLRRLLRVAGPEVVRDHWRGDASSLDRILRIAGSGTRRAPG
jgi:uncharacterized membrane protein YkvA (DUF1232 family)